MADMVAVRVFKNDEQDLDWQESPIVAHMPTFLSDKEANKKNITKRLQLMYFNTDPSIIKIRWHYTDNETEGFWLLREQ